MRELKWQTRLREAGSMGRIMQLLKPLKSAAQIEAFARYYAQSHGLRLQDAIKNLRFGIDYSGWHVEKIQFFNEALAKVKTEI